MIVELFSRSSTGIGMHQEPLNPARSGRGRGIHLGIVQEFGGIVSAQATSREEGMPTVCTGYGSHWHRPGAGSGFPWVEPDFWHANRGRGSARRCNALVMIVEVQSHDWPLSRGCVCFPAALWGPTVPRTATDPVVDWRGVLYRVVAPTTLSSAGQNCSSRPVGTVQSSPRTWSSPTVR